METMPKTLTAAIRYYSDTQTCINAIAALRWADGKPVSMLERSCLFRAST
jgi:hypothetical protein